jgi:predicted AAA+ superfamily ATPase
MMMDKINLQLTMKTQFKTIKRLLKPPQDRSFFLFGPRAVGKSTWVQENLPVALQVDLLKEDVYLELLSNPSLLGATVGHLNPKDWVSIDEIQRIPSLLTEVHRLIESKRLHFALTGSSARKIKRGGADLLGGRAIERFMEPFTCAELGSKFDLERVLKVGGLPLVYLDPVYDTETLATYLNTYLKEEIKEEGLVRKLPAFLRFLEVMGIMNAQQVNAESIAREAKIPRSSVDGYFSILEDTLVGFLLPAYQPKAKVREATHPKFYWFDPGVARACAHLLPVEPDHQWLGSSLETWIYHELRVYNHVYKKMRRFAYHRSPSGLEVDFIIELEPGMRSKKPAVILIEVKLSKKWDRAWNKAMVQLKNSEALRVVASYGIYCGSERLSWDSIQILPVVEFLAQLYAGKIY